MGCSVGVIAANVIIPLILSDEAIISQISWFYPRRLLLPKTGLVVVLSS